MNRACMIGGFALALLFLCGASGQPGPSAPVADFKLSIALYGVRKEPLASAEMVVRRGVGYQFVSDTREEVQIFDPGGSRITLLDLKRKVETEIGWAQLDANLARQRRAVAAAIEQREASDRRADRLAATMSRHLIDPHFDARYDPSISRLVLTNPTVEVEADGEPDSDPARLALVERLLTATAKLGALRDPEGIPPFTRIEALERLAETHHLRPTSVSMLFRLNGPPQRLRWTFRLVPELTAREREAIARVDRLQVECRLVPYRRYEEEEPEG
jgi:hypothetical protein